MKRLECKNEVFRRAKVISSAAGTGTHPALCSKSPLRMLPGTKERFKVGVSSSSWS